MSLEAAGQHPGLATAARKKGQDTPVMFFGAAEVAWVTESEQCEWKAGIAKRYHFQTRLLKRFTAALVQVGLLCTVHHIGSHWFTRVCPPPKKTARTLARVSVHTTWVVLPHRRARTPAPTTPTTTRTKTEPINPPHRPTRYVMYTQAHHTHPTPTHTKYSPQASPPCTGSRSHPTPLHTHQAPRLCPCHPASQKARQGGRPGVCMSSPTPPRSG